MDPYQKPWAQPYDDRATIEDIHFCFRLLLGRNAHREEWAGHSSRAGEPLRDIVSTYLASGEFKGRNLLAREMPANIVRRHNGRFEVFANPDDPVIGGPVLSNRYEPEVTGMVERLLRPGDIFVDVGANLGYFTLLAAPIVGQDGHVYAVEPNDLNVKLLESSIRANGFENISVMQVAAAERLETLLLHSTIGNGTTSAMREHELFSGTSIPGIPLDIVLSGRKKPVALIKIDVEGFEYRVLRGAEGTMRQDRPFIIFEFSAAGIDGIGGEDFLRWLADRGYRFSNLSSEADKDRIEDIGVIMGAFERDMVDHLNILARPEEVPQARL
jgi:FkbM family methyltransferase